MDGKLAFILTVMLALFYVSREADYARDITVAASNIIRVLDDNMPPAKIGWSLGQKTVPIVRSARFGAEKTIYEYVFEETGQAMPYVFRFNKDRIEQARSEVLFDLKKGLPYDLLEKIYVEALARFFHSEPRINREGAFSGLHDVFSWSVTLRDGTYCVMTLYIIHSRRFVHSNVKKILYLWVKPEQVGVFLQATTY